MSKGLFSISTNGFYELAEKLIVGSGKDCDIILEGELAPHQVQVFILENETYIKNLDTKIPVSVNKKILPGKFYLPLLNLSFIEVGDIKFIYSEEGAPRTFQVNKIVDDFDLVEQTNFDKGLMEKAENLEKKIDELSQKVRPVITEMENIKKQIEKAIKERDQKAHEYHLFIQNNKNKFEKIRSENTKYFEDINKFKLEIKKVLKEAAAAKPSTKLELDIK